MEKEGTRERSSEVVGLLAGGLAHDYNNMLTTMLGGMDLILCDDIPATAREAAEDVKATMLKAAALVKRMLSCATGAETQPEPLDLGEAVTDVVRIMRRAIPDNVVVDYRKPAALPKVMADAAMVWQVVMNLVLNACLSSATSWTTRSTIPSTKPWTSGTSIWKASDSDGSSAATSPPNSAEASPPPGPTTGAMAKAGGTLSLSYRYPSGRERFS